MGENSTIGNVGPFSHNKSRVFSVGKVRLRKCWIFPVTFGFSPRSPVNLPTVLPRVVPSLFPAGQGQPLCGCLPLSLWALSVTKIPLSSPTYRQWGVPVPLHPALTPALTSTQCFHSRPRAHCGCRAGRGVALLVLRMLLLLLFQLLLRSDLFETIN